MNNSSRRKFLKHTGLAGMGAFLTASKAQAMLSSNIMKYNTVAVLGGLPTFETTHWVKWPIWIPEQDEKGVLDVLRSGVWSRASVVTEFEKEWARVLDVKRCLTVVNGTNALMVALNHEHSWW